MSLIQEALKRQQEEIGRISTESAERGLVPPKSAPPPVPSSPQPLMETLSHEAAPSYQAPKKSAKVLGVLAASVVLILLLLGAAGYFFMVAAKTYQAGRLPPPGEQTPVVQSGEEDVSKTIVPSTPVPFAPTGKTKPTPVPAQKATPLPKPVRTAAPAPVKPAPVQPAAAPQKPVWPSMTLMGVVVKSEPQLSTAVINSSLYGINDSIEGVRIVDIRHDGVILQYGSEKRMLQLGSSTD
ncbi:MAG: hypothetical protein V2A34_06375 [Lentisphaerota bacterium]